MYPHSIAAHPTKLLSYHAWRSEYSVESRPSWCLLCRRLGEREGLKEGGEGEGEEEGGSVYREEKSKVVKNLFTWWVGVNKCYTNYTSPNVEFSLNSVLNVIKNTVETFNQANFHQ